MLGMRGPLRRLSKRQTVATVGALVLSCSGLLAQQSWAALPGTTLALPTSGAAPEEELAPAVRERDLPRIADFLPRNERALLIGDSHPVSFGPELRAKLAERGWSLGQSTFAGASACDFAGNGPNNASGNPAVGIVSFRGNAYTQCMRPLLGGPDDVAAKTARAVIQICETSGFDVCLIVGQPSEAAPSDFIVDIGTLNAKLRAYAADHPSTAVFLDCGTSVATPDGAYNPLMRDADGVHLNQRGQDAFTLCLADGGF